MRRAKKALIVAASVALAAGVVSVIGIANATTTAVAGIPITMENSGKCLNVAGASTANGAKVVQYTCVASATNDKWVVVPKGNDSDGLGRYWIQGVGSGKCLTVQGASTKNSAALIQYSCTTGGNELWYVETFDDRPTMRLISAGSGLCLDVPGRSTANNVNLVQYTCQAGEGTSNERFIMPPTTSSATVHRPFTSRQPLAVIQGGPTPTGGTAPITYNWIGSDNQLATYIVYDADPYQSDPNAPAPEEYLTQGYGYTGRPEAALLADKRVQAVAHDAADGDVVYNQETQTGTGVYDYLWDIGGAMSAQPTVGAYATGQLATYAIINGALWYDREAAGNAQPPIGGWRSLGGTGLTGVPAIIPSGSGARIFAETTSGQLQTATLSGTTLSDWTALGGSGLGDPDAIVLNGGLGFVTARASDGSIVYKEQTASGWPADWTTISGVTSPGNPSAVVGSADGKVDVVIRGSDNQIYAAQETAAASGQFSGWVQVSNPAGPVPLSDPTAFGYVVPSGQSFAVTFQDADIDSLGPYVIPFPSNWTATPPASSVARAAVSRTGLKHMRLAEAKKVKKLVNAKK